MALLSLYKQKLIMANTLTLEGFIKHKQMYLIEYSHSSWMANSTLNDERLYNIAITFNQLNEIRKHITIIVKHSIVGNKDNLINEFENKELEMGNHHNLVIT